MNKYLLYNLSKKLFFTAIVFSLITCTVQKNKINAPVTTSNKWIDDNLQDATKQYHVMMKLLPPGEMPRSLHENGSIRTCKSDNWVSGFYTGTLLYLSDAVKDETLLKEAKQRILLMDKEQYNKNTHDLGFMMYCSYGNLNRMYPDEKYKEILLNSARSLTSRFNEKVGCIRSWGKPDDSTQFRVIIDNMMNLELLFWATRTTGDSSFYKTAITHANTTIQNHYRSDNSSYHVVVYNPQTGAVISKETAQGAADESAWARGQAWGMYGFTLMYRETKNKKYLDQAQKIAAFMLDHRNLPSDKIPFWDFDAPGIPNTYRDASSAAIMASSLLELARYSETSLSKKYVNTAESIIKTLSSPDYKAAPGSNGGFILKHSVAHLPKNSEVDVALPYADYYYVEALLRLKDSNH